MHRKDLKKALSEFEEARRPDMQALAHLDIIAPQVPLISAGPNSPFLPP